MSAEKIPLVSVIIPMYNSARFIPQTLESLYYQTMKDFEIVIVDDRSTDNSVAIVESLARHFGGRLHLIKLLENSGMPGIPRNVGINFARGKYLAFLDSDDLFTPTALQELTTLAEKFQADVINTTEFLDFYNEKLKPATTIAELFAMNHRVVSCRKAGVSRLNTTTLLPDDIAERIKFWLNNDIHWATCGLFCKKDFMVTNQISYPDMNVCEDQILAFACLCLAKKYLHASNIIYIQRKRMDSISNAAVDAEKFLHKWLSSLNIGFNELNKIMRRFKFFDEPPDYRYAVLNWFFKRVITDARLFTAAYAKVPPAALNQFVEKEFHGDNASLAAYLFNIVNIQRLQMMRLQTENIALKKSLAQK